MKKLFMQIPMINFLRSANTIKKNFLKIYAVKNGGLEKHYGTSASYLSACGKARL